METREKKRQEMFDTQHMISKSRNQKIRNSILNKFERCKS